MISCDCNCEWVGFDVVQVKFGFLVLLFGLGLSLTLLTGFGWFLVFDFWFCFDGFGCLGCFCGCWLGVFFGVACCFELLVLLLSLHLSFGMFVDLVCILGTWCFPALHFGGGVGLLWL